MFAVIKTGGKQYKVSRGDVLRVEKLTAEAGDTVRFDSVLMMGGGSGGTTLGTPLVDGAAVTGEVVEQIRDKKIYAFKKRRRKHSSKTLKGHRQYLTVVRITGFDGAGDALVDLDDIGAELDLAADSGGQDAPDAVSDDAPQGNAERPGNLLDAANGEADDLTKLPQVGDVYAGRMNDLGVFHFSQITDWGPANWNWVEGELDIPGGIDRAGWLVIANKIIASRT